MQNFNSWTIRFTNKPFGTWHFGKIGVFVNFSISQLKLCKIAQALLYQFLRWEVFLREPEKIFSTYSGPKSVLPVTPTWFISILKRRKYNKYKENKHVCILISPLHNMYMIRKSCIFLNHCTNMDRCIIFLHWGMKYLLVDSIRPSHLGKTFETLGIPRTIN